ncbi:MAG TPA: polysaccharide deacetylase family protein [Thermoanaerobacterales bacterium]|nr:polysaccharide deacetylase family protein [Thermoanaerobacterales bacterium]
METQFLLETGNNVQIPYLKYTMLIIFVLLFSFWIFPGYSSSGQTEHVVIQEEYIDFFDEEEMRQLKEHQIKNNSPLPVPVISSDYVRQGSKELKKVAITFDDGPHFLTGEYLDILETYNIPATFFLIGIHVEKYPDEAKMIIDSKNELGLHSYSHKQLTKMAPDYIKIDFQDSLTAVNNIAETDIRFFRPPFGDFNDTIIEAAKDHDLITILWCVDPRDWKINDPQQIAKHVIQNAENGSIILLHEGRQSTLEALPYIIEGLWHKGFEIVSLSELLLSL